MEFRMNLQERMQKTVSGQAAWADPTLGKTCSECRWCVRHPKPKKMPKLEDQCQKVFVHSSKPGVPFNAKLAIACSLFSVQEYEHRNLAASRE